MGDMLDDDLLAVVAHSLLNSMSVISGNAETLAEHWERIAAETRLEFLDRIVTQSAHVVGVLTDLVRSGRPELVEALERMQNGDGIEPKG
jgi:signal transduction histidine kinase